MLGTIHYSALKGCRETFFLFSSASRRTRSLYNLHNAYCAVLYVSTQTTISNGHVAVFLNTVQFLQHSGQEGNNDYNKTTATVMTTRQRCSRQERAGTFSWCIDCTPDTRTSALSSAHRDRASGTVCLLWCMVPITIGMLSACGEHELPRRRATSSRRDVAFFQFFLLLVRWR